ncbi:MAG: thioredoxin domain-containing protein [Wenzhouxiangellaceae bacterium]|nr:thioredoxin domain-containing protein [Wenzhouxiangellaceae bacterium]
MPNRLRDSLSPYLHQHAENPVDWHPWDPEALAAARTSDRPILLSIGYSACHWCHVMAHESFEDEAVARRMNAWFVNVKVDREERPDLDRIYQLAHQLLTGRGGGWPLTVFLDPTDLSAFVAGTYFPPQARHGLIGFPDLLERVHDAWLNRRDELKAQNRQLSEALEMITARRSSPDPAAGDPEATLLGQCDARIDRRHGGFGGAPKFPQAPLLEWLGARAGDPASTKASEGDEQAAQMLDDTLAAMARNGLFDHLGGGFFRYCVDAAWEIPHFEKMLADNAQLLPRYAEAAVRWGRDDYALVAERTAEFLAEELELEDGGLATSLDADSLPADADDSQSEPALAHEGEYYVWTRQQFEACLDRDLLELANARFGLDGPANFEGRRWHLLLARSLTELTDAGHDADQVAATLERARRQLLECRRRRPRPGRDDKMLAGLNALAAAGLVRAGRLLGRDDWTGRGETIADRVWERLFAEPLRSGAGPRAVWRAGRSAHPALLDDHAALLFAATELLQARWRDDWLERAEALAGRIRENFHDAATRTLFLTPHDHERLPIRPTANVDDATPAGAAVAVRGLARLGHLTGNADWLEMARGIVAGCAGELQRAPMACASMLLARREIDDPLPLVLIGGGDDRARQWHARLRGRPDVHCYRVERSDTTLPGPLAGVAGRPETIAVVCLGMRCLAPITEFDDLVDELARQLGDARR